LLDTEDDSQFGIQQNVYCLPTITSQWTPVSTSPNRNDRTIGVPYTSCLILARNTTSKYRRFGYVGLNYLKAWRNVFPPVGITII
jgi:hypothetical protein